jgi:FtsP/CotA-like multicopper oxidase with cupredoxin domain
MRVTDVAGFIGLSIAGLVQAGAAELAEPPMLAAPGDLRILMVARPQLMPFTGQPAGYAYEVCPLPADPAARRCPVPGHTTDLHACPAAADLAVSPYGGTRLQLTPGHTLHVRLVNCLPPAVDAKRAGDDPLLQANPTNLHTHGLIVEPRRADDAHDPFGDYVFVLDLPPGTHPPKPGTPPHGGHDHARAFDYREQVTDYAIPVPASHPAGLFWFHPHVHALALPQVSGGLAGIITVGDVHAYACDHGAACAPGQLRPQVRHLVLKDAQITSDYRVRFQQNPAMCASPDAPSNIGGCAGLASASGTAATDNDGRWEFTINGQTYPDIRVNPAGEIWRLANASASATYNLGLFPPGAADTGAPLVFQVLAVDGVSLVVPPGIPPDRASALLGGKVTVAACPGPPAASGPPPLCATSLRMMPSARAEIFLPPHAGQGPAVLRTVNRQTGPAGDDWPRIDLARVVFPPAPGPPDAPGTLAVAPTMARAVAPGGVLSGQVTTRVGAAAVPVSALAGGDADGAHRARAASLHPGPGLDCTALPRDRVRQVLFGLPPNPDNFGLGYRIVAAGDTGPPPSAGAPAIVAFDHAAPPTVCVPLGPDGAAVTETWMLVNLAAEDHNFHIHQTRFSVIATPGDGETALPPAVDGTPVLLDNVPLPHAQGDACDGTTAPWIAGTCKPTIVTVSIPFHEVGDFVYHCHILEHEDGGMMAKITVVPHGH